MPRDSGPHPLATPFSEGGVVADKRLIRRPGRAVLLLALVAGLACGDSSTAPPRPPPPPPPPAPQPAAVTVTPATAELTALGDTVRLSAEVRDQTGQVMVGATVSWSSDDTSVATVDATGLVTAVGAGTAVVDARAGSVTGEARVSVRLPADTVVVTPSSAELTVLGDTLRLSAEARDVNGQSVAGTVFEWSSSDASVVTVDAAGLVTAAGAGTAVVTARAGSATGEARVSVQQSISAVVVKPPKVTIAVGDTLRLSAEARDANGHAVAGAVFEWSSSDAAVATVGDAGLVRALAEGIATIAARSDTITGTSSITVPDPDPERAALKALYRSTGGPGWTNRDGWLSDEPLGQWHGVETDASGRVTTLYLREHNLIGALPAGLGDLSRLEVLNLHANRLTGPLPPGIGNVTSLRELDLGHNRLDGTIPATLGKLVSLRRLNLETNRLTGPIPPELGALTELRFLNFYNNTLSGRVPAELAGLAQLERLFVDRNQLT